MKPGLYIAKTPGCWSGFVLYADGRVVFVDAEDGHLTHSHKDMNPGWEDRMQALIAKGELKLTVPHEEPK